MLREVHYMIPTRDVQVAPALKVKMIPSDSPQLGNNTCEELLGGRELAHDRLLITMRLAISSTKSS